MEKRTAVAIYARISQDRDNTGMAVSRQLADCWAGAKKRGWKVAEEYVDDDISASSFASKIRPAYQRMLTDIEDGNSSRTSTAPNFCSLVRAWA
jgi:site-specific DNA recombinase